MRRRRRREEFDGNFDPDRVGRGDGTDLMGAGGAGVVEPYSYGAPVGGYGGGEAGASGYGGQEMAQHGGDEGLAAGRDRCAEECVEGMLCSGVSDSVVGVGVGHVVDSVAHEYILFVSTQMQMDSQIP